MSPAQPDSQATVDTPFPPRALVSPCETLWSLEQMDQTSARTVNLRNLISPAADRLPALWTTSHSLSGQPPLPGRLKGNETLLPPTSPPDFPHPLPHAQSYVGAM